MNYCNMNGIRLFILYEELSLERDEETVNSYWTEQLTIKMEESKTKNKPKNK